MPMQSTLHRHILLPVFETLIKRRNVFRYWRELERTQWLTRGELEALQFQSLRRLLRHAYHSCPHYHEQWARLGLDPRRLGNLGDFRRWPVIDRQTIRDNRLSLRAHGGSLRLITKSTGGSSGVPLQFDLNDDSHDRRVAAWHRGYGWAQAGPGTKQLYLWGVPLRHRSSATRIKDRLYHWLYRRRVLSCFEMGEGHAVHFAAELNRYRPEVIVAYTNPLYELARRLAELGTKACSPASIVVGAEKLHGFQRELIERVLGAPVFETYGSREFMLIGAECDRHEGLHLTMENLLVEVLDDEGQPVGDGQEGNVVITDLHNYGMPFIRYANGDRAVAGWGTCSCGRGLPLLRKVLGRRLDILHTPDGRLIPGEFFPHLLKEFTAVRRFQVVQDAPDRVRISLVAQDLSATDHDELRRTISSAVGPRVRVELKLVEHIRLTAAGKLQVVINQVRQ